MKDIIKKVRALANVELVLKGLRGAIKNEVK